jgi:tripartite-type tricarboxylate transporter receptor subunit TctC
VESRETCREVLAIALNGDGRSRRDSSRAPGSLPHLFGAMIANDAGLDLVHVPFIGGGPLQNALVGNQVSSGIDTLVDQAGLHRSGKTRILATSAATRSPLLAEVPTFVEAGPKGVEGTVGSRCTHLPKPPPPPFNKSTPPSVGCVPERFLPTIGAR